MSDTAAGRPRPRPPGQGAAPEPARPESSSPEPARPAVTRPDVATEPVTAGPYVSSVRAPAQVGLGTLVALGGALVLVELGVWPLAIVAVVIVAVTTYFLSGLTVTVTPQQVAIAQGRGERDPRTVAAGEIATAEAATFTWPQCLGLDALRRPDGPADEPRPLITRLAVRPGSTLCLTLRSGELVRVSVRDAEQAVAVLTRRG